MITPITETFAAISDLRRTNLFFQEDVEEYLDGEPRFVFFESKAEQIYDKISSHFFDSQLQSIAMEAVWSKLRDMGSIQAIERANHEEDLDGLF